MADKKYIGNGFVGGYENSANIEISIPQLATALGIDVNVLKKAFLPAYDANTKTFKTPALYVKRYQKQDGTKVEELCLKISTGLRMSDDAKLNVTLNEFVKTNNVKQPKPDKAQQTQPTAKQEDADPFALQNDDGGDLPF